MLNPDLFYQYSETRSIALRNEIVTQNLGLVKTIVNRLECHEPFDDLYHQGVIGLIKAVERFDPYAGYQFSSYATKFIKGEVLHYVRDKSNTIRLRRGFKPLRVISTDRIRIKDLKCAASDHSDLKLDVKRGISKLEMQERRLIRLYYFDGLRYKDIAEILKIHPCTVQRTMQRCIEKLKESLSEYAQ